MFEGKKAHGGKQMKEGGNVGGKIGNQREALHFNLIYSTRRTLMAMRAASLD